MVGARDTVILLHTTEQRVRVGVVTLGQCPIPPLKAARKIPAVVVVVLGMAMVTLAQAVQAWSSLNILLH